MAKITIFGLAGTGTTSAGKALAEKLGYLFVSSGNIFREMARENGMTLKELEEISKTDPRHDNKLDRRMKEFGEANDNFIVESRLAWHFIPDSVKIKLFCDFDTRIRRIASRDGISFEEAREHTQHREDAIFERYEKYYGMTDFGDKNFDMVIDTTNTPIDGVVEKIAATLGSNLSDK